MVNFALTIINNDMKKFTLLILFILISSLVFSKNNCEDVVYLKNGTIIRGTILEYKPDESIKIKIMEGRIFIFKMVEVEKCTKEPVEKSKPGNVKTSTGFGLTKGYVGIVDVGYEFSIGLYNRDRFQVDIINGYQFNPYFSIGLGTGLRIYPDVQEILIPLYTDFRVTMMDNKVSPYFSAAIGYSFKVTDGSGSSGFLFNPTLGITLKVSENSLMFLGLGYELQVMEIIDRFTFPSLNGVIFEDVYYVYTDIVGAINITVGISF